MKDFAQKHKRSLFIILVLVICAAVAIASYVFTRGSAVEQGEPVITFSTDTPDESKKNADTYQWRGTAAQPKKIHIEKINVDAFIQHAGVDQYTKVAVPNNIHLAGWFNQSALPGESGLAVIAGHVSGARTDGIFKHLARLELGDLVEIERGDGTITQYVVFEKKVMEESKSAAYLFSQNPQVKSQLNLITCGGDYSSSQRQYEDRIIVSTKLL